MAGCNGVSFPGEVDFFQKFLSVLSKFAIFMIGPLRRHPLP
jgi:hypothetical protein